MRRIAIFGGGPAGLMAADVLADACEVHVYERGRTLGRKFLVAGEGGLNITNGVEGEELARRYTPPDLMRRMLSAFGPTQLRAWLASIGIPTYVGSSGRVFPVRGITPAQVLKAIRSRLSEKGVHFHPLHRFVEFDADIRPIVEHAEERTVVIADHYLFALGGASWPRTGSVGDWREAFEAIGIPTRPFRSSNCGLEIALPPSVLLHAGKPLKNIAVEAGNIALRGEALLTDYGLEGNAIYPVVPAVREQLDREGPAILRLDLKPDGTVGDVYRRIIASGARRGYAEVGLDRAQWALLKAFTTKDEFNDAAQLAMKIKALDLPVRSLRPIEEAISTVGGVALEAVNAELRSCRHHHLSIVGEMLDSDAPTGGFLLQSAFSMGYWAARALTTD